MRKKLKSAEWNGCFGFNMYDLIESNCHHLYENSWNIPSEKIAFVSTCMIWMNQNVIICMKIVKIYQSIWFGEIKLYQNSWNMSFVSKYLQLNCMIWRNQIEKKVEICRVKWLLWFQHVWFDRIKLPPFVWK